MDWKNRIEALQGGGGGVGGRGGIGTVPLHHLSLFLVAEVLTTVFWKELVIAIWKLQQQCLQGYPLRMHQGHTLELFVLANENTKYSATQKKIYDGLNDSQISFVALCFQHYYSFLEYKNITELHHVWTL
jgi:hypothetical protein